MGLSAHSARSRTAVCTLPGGWFGRAKSRGYTSSVLPAAGNSGKNGCGIIVSCLQQYQMTVGFRPGNNSSGMAARTP